MCTSANVLAPVDSERVHYFSRQLITADDMRAEQEYFRQKLRRHNRYLHGWGVVCGCAVEVYPDATHPWQVRVCPGYLITPQGDEILIGDPVNFDVAGDSRQIPDPCANPSPCSPAKTGIPPANDETYVYLAACYTECETRPVRVHPVGCACDESACDYSRIRDSFELMILPALPVEVGFTEGPGGILCPTGPGGACVVLARIRLPIQKAGAQGAVALAPNMPLQPGNISYVGRRILRPVMELPTPPTIVSIFPLNGGSGSAGGNVAVTFDRKMNIPNPSGAMTVDGQPFSVSPDTTGTSMSGTLASPLPAGTHVIKVLANGVQDLCGATIISDYTWTFTSP